MFTPIKLDKARNFRYGMKAMDLIEKQLKKTISKIDFDDLSMKETATIMCAGLVHEDKSLTADRVMELVDEHSSFKEAMELMVKAFMEGLGVENKDESNEGESQEKNQ